MLALTHIPSPLLTNCELTHVARQTIDCHRAAMQHAAYCAALQLAGVEVRTFDFIAKHADCAFVEDMAVVLDELIILACPGADSRRAEAAAWYDTLAGLRTLRRLPPGARLDGGDVLRIGRELLVGQSTRTNHAALRGIVELVTPLGYQVRPVAVRGCLHLKTGCTALDDETLLINSNWIDPKELPDKGIVVARDRWGANVVRLPDRLLANAENQQTLDQLARLGYQIAAIDLSEFAKAEAGPTCLSLLI